MRKVRRRLGGTDSLIEHFPDRPKGMWQRTYLRLRDKMVSDEARAETMFVIQRQQLLDRLNRHGKRLIGRKEDFCS